MQNKFNQFIIFWIVFFYKLQNFSGILKGHAEQKKYSKGLSLTEKMIIY
jgi:hypothetical protein